MSRNVSSSGREDKLILALAAGCSVKEAARRAGITARTAFRKLGDHEFRRRVTETRAQIFERTAARLAALTLSAVSTLRKLLDAEAEPVRLGAARAILDSATRLRAEIETEQRLLRLEQQHGIVTQNTAT